MSDLHKIAKRLVAPKKGILAADEGTGTIERRLKSINVESTEENRRAYRQLLFTAPKIEKYISGVIMFDETIKQSNDNNIPFPKVLEKRGIIPGIKVDQGKDPFPQSPEEHLTKGLDGLPGRLASYIELGAKFTKWRAVMNIGDGLPTENAIKQNSEKLADYAKTAQDVGLVPIVEPEVLMDGVHDIKRNREVTHYVLKAVFISLDKYGVDLQGALLKPNMVVPGKDSGMSMDPKEVAENTIECFKEVVPNELPGIVFLSGGISPEQATANLNEMNKIGGPWELSFSFGRALQAPVLEAWKGNSDNIEVAQKEFLHRAKMNSLARTGKYKQELENQNE